MQRRDYGLAGRHIPYSIIPPPHQVVTCKITHAPPSGQNSKLFFSRQHDRCKCRAMCLWKHTSTFFCWLFWRKSSLKIIRGGVRFLAYYSYAIPNIILSTARCAESIEPTASALFLAWKIRIVSLIPQHSPWRGGAWDPEINAWACWDCTSNPKAYAAIGCITLYPLADMATWLSRSQWVVLYNQH